MTGGLRVTKQQFVERMRESSKDDELPRVKSMIFFALQYTTLEKAGFVLVDKQALSLSERKEATLRKQIEDLQKALEDFPEVVYSKDDSKNINGLVKIIEWKQRYRELFSVFVGEFEGLSKALSSEEPALKKETQKK